MLKSIKETKNFATINIIKYSFLTKALNLISNKFLVFVIKDIISRDILLLHREEEVIERRIEGFVK